MALWAVLSDTQFDEQLSYSSIRPDGISTRLADSIACFDWIVQTALARKCKGLIHLGDVFDSRTTIDVSVLDQVGRAFWRAHDEGLEINLLCGNHDSYLRTPALNSLWPFSGVANVIDEPLTHEGFGFIPWIEDDDVFAEQVRWLAEETKAQYLFAHCMIEGAVPAAVGVGRPIEVLRQKRWKHVILGDVHEPVQLATNVRYCGSPMQWHYGDAGRKRGFLILDDQTGKVEFIENTLSPRFHLLDAVDDGAVRKGDFVRVRTDDPVLSQEIVKSVAKAAPARVESQAVEIADKAPRLPITAKDAHGDVLARYVAHHGLEDVEGLVDLGLEILEEARHE